jgi:hypothetical protein
MTTLTILRGTMMSLRGGFPPVAAWTKPSARTSLFHGSLIGIAINCQIAAFLAVDLNRKGNVFIGDQRRHHSPGQGRCRHHAVIAEKISSILRPDAASSAQSAAPSWFTACLQADFKIGIGPTARNIGQRGGKRVDQFVEPGDCFVEGELFDVFADQP